MTHQAYRYPLLEAFIDGETPESLLELLRERRWIEQTHLVDRLRRCGSCSSVHLNYVDVCPSCQGLNIEEAIYIHCFTCSHLAPQDRFVRRGALACPNCHSRLRHIGVDYNRPLEQMHCRDCAMAFADAKVLARCLECSREHEPERLSAISISSYALSDAGRQVARQGMENGCPMPSAFRPLGMTPEAFVEVVDWMMNLSRRHEGADFALIGLSVSAEPGLESAEFECLNQSFTDRLRELIRDTDLLAQVNRHLIWIMLPKTSRKGGEAMLEKVARLAEKTVQENGTKLEVCGVVHTVDDSPEDASAEQILNSLGARLQRGIPC